MYAAAHGAAYSAHDIQTSPGSRWLDGIEVDWYEMAEHYLYDVEKESDEDEETEESETPEVSE